MKYAIIGSGDIGTALARIFARKNIEVAIANSRGPKTLASLREEMGPTVFPQSIQDAYQAEMIFLAVPFPARAVGRSICVTQRTDLPVEHSPEGWALGGGTSSTHRSGAPRRVQWEGRS